VLASSAASRTDLAHHVFFVDQMARLLELVEQLADVAGPVVEHLVGRLRRLERDDAGGAVDAREDLLLRHHLAQLLLHLLHGETRQLGQPGHADPPVVPRHDLYVVLRDARVHRLEHQLALLVGELSKERELCLEPGFELGEVEDLLRDEELEQLLEHRQLLQLLLRRAAASGPTGPCRTVRAPGR